MSTLHLINRPAAFPRCLATAAAGDTILCYENGVLACVAAHSGALPASVTLVALRHDVEAMGLRGRLAVSVGIVDDAGFVELVARHQPIVSWT